MSAPDSTSVPVLPDWSAYAGEAFNLSERRPLTIVAESDEQVVADGFYHWGQFWKAVIPRRGVAEIIGQRLNFSPRKREADGTTRPSLFFLNHVQARLKMEPERAVRLYPLDGEPTGEPVHRVSDFCYSVEAVGPYGRHWNLSDAMLGNLAIVHRFLSTEDVAFERIMRERMKIIQSPPLPLEPDIRDRMLYGAICESHATGLARPYFMFRAPFSATNCASEPFRLLDGVTHMPLWRRFLYRLPVHPRGYLKMRGLWQEGHESPTLNEEMADWLASDEARERRSIYVQSRKREPKGAAARVSWRKHLSSFARAMRAGRE
jgi:hypothetical protein